MNISKDEARILGEMLGDHLSEIANHHPQSGNTEERKVIYRSLEVLEKRLKVFGKDERRQGRHTLDDFSDCVKRFTLKYVTERSKD